MGIWLSAVKPTYIDVCALILAMCYGHCCFIVVVFIIIIITIVCYDIHTHTRLTALCPGLPR